MQSLNTMQFGETKFLASYETKISRGKGVFMKSAIFKVILEILRVISLHRYAKFNIFFSCKSSNPKAKRSALKFVPLPVTM